MKEGGGSDILLHLMASLWLIFDPPTSDARTSLQHRFIYILNLTSDYCIILVPKAGFKPAQFVGPKLSIGAVLI